MESISHTSLLDSPSDVAQRYDLALLIQQVIDGPPGVLGQRRGPNGADLKQPRSKRWPPFESARCRAVPPSHVSSALLGDFTNRNRRRGPGGGDVRDGGLRGLGAYRNRLRGSYSLPTGEQRRTWETLGDRAPWASSLSLPMAKIIRPARTSVVTPIPSISSRRTTRPRQSDHSREPDTGTRITVVNLTRCATGCRAI
jgi:hypothetical protein